MSSRLLVYMIYCLDMSFVDNIHYTITGVGVVSRIFILFGGYRKRDTLH